MSVDTVGKVGGTAAEPSSVPGAAASPAPKRSRLGKGGRILERLAGPVLVLAAWFLVTGAGWVSETVLPSPGQVWDAARELISTGALREHLFISLQRALAGLGIGLVAGTVLAVISGLSRWGENLIDANMQMLRAMPILAMVPLAIVWFGIGEQVKIILVALGVAFPVYLNTHAAIRGVDTRYYDLATSVGLSRLALIRRVILPGAMPGFFVGLRYAVAIAWLVLVVSEQINANSGIGYLMTQARSVSATDVIVVGLIVYALLGLISDTLVRLIQGRALRWQSTLQQR